MDVFYGSKKKGSNDIFHDRRDKRKVLFLEKKGVKCLFIKNGICNLS